MNTRQMTKGGTYINTTVQLQQFRLQNEVESSGFLSKCAESIVLVSVLKQTPPPVMLLRNYGGGSIILPPDNGILKHPRHFIT